jgi:hypothetical protein
MRSSQYIRLSSIVVNIALATTAQTHAITVTEMANVYTTACMGIPSETPVHTALAKRWWWKNNSQLATNDPAAITAVSTITLTQNAAEPTLDTILAASSEDPDYIPTSATSAPLVVASTSNSYAALIVDHHNAHRANHSAPPLAWDDTAAATALKIANSCNYAHDT